MNEVNVAVSDIEPPGWLPRLECICQTILGKLPVSGKEVSILLCSDLVISRLNRKYRQIDAPTDVLAFPQEDGETPGFSHDLLGDVVISVETLKRNSQTLQIPFEEEFFRLLIHGLLHLMGLEHEEMLEKQEKIVNYVKKEKLI